MVVTLSAPANASIATGAGTGTGTITDDDAAPTVSIDSPGVTEGDSGTQPLTFTVTLSAVSAQQVTVAYADAGTGTATSGTDYTAIAAGTLTFAAGTTTRTFDVAVIGDVLDEADETIAVTLSTPVNATLAAGAATGTGTVTDDDDAPTVSIDSPSVAEGTGTTGGTLTFTVTLSAASGRPVTVAHARTGGTATSGADYTALSAGRLTFAAGTTTRTIDVSVTGDATDEADETVVVTLSAPMHAALATAAGTGTITDDDGAPTVSIDSPSVTEGTGAAGGTLRFTVTLSAASGKPVTVAYADAGTGTATSGTDYTALTAGTLTFTAGTTTRTIDVSVTGDATDEANETVAVTLSTPVNATLAAAATGTGTVTDDDDAPTVSIDAPHVVEGAAGTTATLRFTVALSAASGRPVTVAYADAGTGTATSGTDYTAITAGTLTFTAGTTTRTIDVTVTGDAADEQNETVAVTLSTPVNATLAAGAATGTGTVVDDDGAPTLTLDAPSVTEGADGATPTLRFTVALSPASAQQVTVSYRDAGTGTATSGTDYTALAAGTLTFAAGTTTRTIDVTVTGDAADEADETVAIALSAPVNAALGLAAGTGTINDDDDAPTVSIDSPSVTEGTGAAGGTLTFTVTLSAASGRPVTVAYARTGGTATAGAAGAPGTDYTAVPAGTLTFAPGTTSRTIDVVVTSDAADEPDETVAVTLSAPANATIHTGAGTGTITDDDDAPTVSVDSPSVVEGAPGTAAALRFTVRLSPVSGRQVTVAYAVAGAGTATSGEDYAALAAGTLTFAPGTATRTIDVSVTGDAAGEPDETVVVTLSAPVNASLAAGAATGTGTIRDDDTDRTDLMPSFGDARVPPQRYVQEIEIAPFALPAATGGDPPLTYALTGPALPEGLAWSEAAVTSPPHPGSLAGTPTVPAPPAAWTLTATDADGDRATLRFTIEVLDRLRERLKGINEAILPDLARAMTASTLDAVTGRIGQALSPDGAGAPGATAPADMLTGFAGVLKANEQAIEDGTWSWKQGLDGQRFALALSGGGAGGEGAGGGTATGIGAGPAPDPGARVTVWGAGDYRSLAGGEGSAVDWDGHLFGAHLGMDARYGAGGLAGLALSVSEGRFDYTDTSAYARGKAIEGEYESRMTSAHPYVGWAWPAGAHAWASLGYGRGDVTITDGEAGRQTSDSRLRSAAVGGSVRVLSGEGPGVFGPVTVDLKGEAWTARLEVEDNGERIAGLAVRTHRLRVAAEGARAFALGGGASFTPSVELGMRLDRGDGETGAGMELGGGLDYAHPALGLRADVAGRALLAHEGATEEWSVGGAVRLEPSSGRGLSLRLAPSYGDTGSGPLAAVGARRGRERRRRNHRRISDRAAGHRDGLRPGGVRRGADPLRRRRTVRGRHARLPAGRALPARPGLRAGP